MVQKIKIEEKTALLDKVIFGGISIIQIDDMEKLVEAGIVQQGTAKAKYMTAAGQEFDRILIENDGIINKLTAGSKILANKRVDYCHLECCVKNTGYGNLSCYTVQDYLERLQEIEKHLIDTYGIHVDLSDITIREIEVNRTFRLHDDFSEYHRCITLLMANLPQYLKNQMDFKKSWQNNVEYQTYYATSKTTNKSKRYLLFKIYNKSRSLENIVLLTDSYMRVEFRLVGAEKVKRSLGTNKFAELTDQLINKYYDEQVQKLLIEPYERWRSERDKHITELMQEQREADIRHWQTNVLRIIMNEEVKQKHPLLLDISELLPLVNNLNISSKRRYEVKKNFSRQAQKFETVLCSEDHKKLQEIMDKLTVNDTANNTVNKAVYTAIVPNIEGIGKIA